MSSVVFRVRFGRLIGILILISLVGASVQAAEPPPKKGVAAQAVRAVLRVFTPKVPPAVNLVPPVLPPEAAQAPVNADPDSAADELEKKLKKKPAGEQTAKRFKSQIGAITRSELVFMHDVCELRRSQFDSIRVKADAATRLVALKAASVEIAMHNGWDGRQPKTPDVNGTIETALLNAAEKYVDQRQLKLYQDEIRTRQSFRKEAEASVILGYIDRELMLTAKQREALLPSLVKAWKSDWSERLGVMEGNGIQFLPAIPKSEIRKHLEPLQKQLFDSAFKQSHSVFFGMQMHNLPRDIKGLPPLEEVLEFAPEEATN